MNDKQAIFVIICAILIFWGSITTSAIILGQPSITTLFCIFGMIGISILIVLTGAFIIYLYDMLGDEEDVSEETQRTRAGY